MIEKINNVFYRCAAAVGSLSYIGIVAMTLLNLLDVILTKVFEMPIQGAYELTERLLMCTVFASLAYGQALQGPCQHHSAGDSLPPCAEVPGLRRDAGPCHCGQHLWTYGAYTRSSSPSAPTPSLLC